MKTKKLLKVITAAITLLLLVTAVLIIYNRNDAAAEPEVSAVNTEPSGPAESAAPAEAEVGTGMKDGERFEAVIMLEGMEETVNYEHIRSDALGFEMDFDYDLFVRDSQAGRECFVSRYDDPEDPRNYLEVIYNPQDADTVAAAVSAELSVNYDIIREPLTLERAGSCIRIDASNAKGNGGTPDQLAMVYIIPAADGSRVAAAHYGFESAEGFGRRFSYFMNSFSVIAAQGEKSVSDEQAIYAVRKYCYSQNADLERLVKAGEYPVYWEVSSSDEQQIVVLFRSYTGALFRFYIDPGSGEAYVTEYVPGISSEETRTGETLNVWDYMI